MINENDIIIDGLAEKVFPYLNDLRESGEINMFEAPQYVMEDFDISKSMARTLVSAWMMQFNSNKEKEHEGSVN